jgi:hypothetical protein
METPRIAEGWKPPRRKGNCKKMKRFVVLIALLGGSLVNAQEIEHAPTVEQCRADANLWKAQLEEYKKASETDRLDTTVSHLTIFQLGDRLNEMSQCVEVDQPWNDHSRDYLNLNDSYTDIVNHRYYRYLVRKHLMDDVFREDRQGLR